MNYITIVQGLKVTYSLISSIKVLPSTTLPIYSAQHMDTNGKHVYQKFVRKFYS